MSTIEIPYKELQLLLVEAEDGIKRHFDRRKKELIALAEPKYNGWRRLVQKILRTSRPRLLTDREIFDRETGSGDFTPLNFLYWAFSEDKELITNLRLGCARPRVFTINLDLTDLRTLTNDKELQ